MKEKSIIIGLETDDNYKDYDQSMEELRSLAESAGAEVLARADQRGRPNPKTFIGSGKLEEIKEMAENMEVDSLIFNTELSGSQIRNIESKTGKKIVDRTTLILDIFAQRARTKESVLQVSLAQAQYILPRLAGYGKELSRTGGGIGTRGPGEQQIETDRRHVRAQISKIKKSLEVQEKNRQTKSKKRRESPISLVSLVGYTNVGKSTIMNKVIDLVEADKDGVYADDRLFATLETSHRSVNYKGTPFVLADTVGLIEDLPVNLIEAFKSTLEEVRDSDLILVVLDASTQNINRQLSSITKTLEDMEAGDTDRLLVYNKVDMDQGLRPKLDDKTIDISAYKDEDITRLLDEIKEILDQDKILVKLLIPYKDADLYAKLRDKYSELEADHLDEGIFLEANLTKKEYERLKEYEVQQAP